MIIFYNHYHNGDLFHSKAFVEDIVVKTGERSVYAHNKNPKLLRDLPCVHSALPQLPQKETIFQDGDNTFINTWIGAHFDRGYRYNGECSLQFNYEMYKPIYEKLNIQMEPIEYYYPSIIFDVFDCHEFRHVIDGRKTIMISNGPAFSDQCRYNDDMEAIINELANVHKNKRFIATHKFPTDRNNVEFTSDLIKRDCDLNEIAFISQKADLIVGRVSGPFCFMTHRNNIMNPSKKFVAFGNRVTDFFHLGCQIKAEYKYHEFIDEFVLYNTLDQWIRFI